MYRVVDMQERYLDEVLKIEHASFEDPWPVSAFMNELRHPWSWFKVAGEQGDLFRLERVMGFIICWMLPGDLHLLNLAVVPECRRKGIGSRMLNDSLNAFSLSGGGLVSLEVRPSNLAARQMYKAHGFGEIGRRPGYYRRQDEDAIVMARKVDKRSGTRHEKVGG